MGREFELKYKANPGILPEIQNKYGNFIRIEMETAYYDTQDRTLSTRRWTLRRRLENGRSVCTLKVPLPDGSRGEWEVEQDTIEAGVFALCKLDTPPELAMLSRSPLIPVCAARFTRLAKTLVLPDCVVELALDQGVLTGGGQELPFAEVEAELKEGSEAAVRQFAAALAREFDLTPEPKSKQQRALELRG